MLQPAPTSAIDPSQARGTLLGTLPASGSCPGFVRVTFPNTSYDLHLVPVGEVTPNRSGRVVGTIHLAARRIDVVDTGGRFIEPVIGRPRRVQGIVLGTRGDELLIHAGVPVHVRPTDPRQKPSDFPEGVMVAFDALPGAEFRPAL